MTVDDGATLDIGEEASGSALLIVSRNNYQNGQTMNINIDSGVTFEHTAQATQAADVEVFQKQSGQCGITAVNINHKTETLEYYDGTYTDCTVTVKKVID